MKRILLYLLTRVIPTACLVCSSFCTRAQDNPYLSVTYKDSLYADENSYFVYNHVSIFNTYSKAIGFTFSVDVPEGWKLLSQNNLYLELAPGNITPISITLNRLKTAVAAWETVTIKIWPKNSPDTFYYRFFVKASVINKYRAGMLLKEITLLPNGREASLPIRIFNSGNITQHYNLYFYNERLNVKENVKISLPPGKDTIYRQTIRTGVLARKQLVDESIFLSLLGPNNQNSFFSYRLRRLSSFRRMHNTAYSTFPAVVQVGLVRSNGKLSGYFSSSMVYDFKNDDKLYFEYQSRQFGIGGMQRNIFNFMYAHKRWKFAFGRVNELGAFYTNGNGLRVQYNKNDSFGFAIYGTHSNYARFHATNIGGTLDYRIKRIAINHELVYNRDYTKNENACIQENKVLFINTRKKKFLVHGGIGLLHNTRKDLVNSGADHFGFSLGYLFNDSLSKRWLLRSQAQHNSNTYPGSYQGYRLQLHELQYRAFKSLSMGATYSSSYFEQSFFRDSIFYRSLLLANTRQYGVEAILSTRHFHLNVGAGKMTNAVHQIYAAPVYNFENFGFGFSLFHQLSFSLSGTIGDQPDYGPLKQKVHLYSVMGAMYSKWGGIQLMTDQLPIFDYINNTSVFAYYQRLKNIGPYLNINFLKDHVQLRLQYNHSRLDPGKIVQENATVSLSYISKSDLRFNLTSSTTYTNRIYSRFAVLTVSKPLSIPKPRSRRYYDLKVILYNDLNKNEHRDENEPLLINAFVLINRTPYISDRKGEILLHNTDKGLYELDFHSLGNMNGLIPGRGFMQRVNVEKSITEWIPFKKGHVLQGTVMVTRDTLSNLKFSPDLLKITATDSSGEKYSTLTDAHGKFSLAVPAGRYIVALNPAAFDDTFKPVQMAFIADLINNEIANIYFEVKQKQRKVIRVKADVNQ